MTSYERGAIVLLPVPFSNQRGAKRRPAVVVSSTAFNTSGNDVIVAAITSRTEGLRPVGERLLADWQAAGLLKPSALKAALASVEQTLIAKELGRLSDRDLIEVDRALAELLGLPR